MQIVKTTEEIQKAIIESGISQLETQSCSICGFMMCYLFHNGSIVIDTNCNCVNYYTPPQSVSIEEFADYYNRNQPINNPAISLFWVERINNALGYTEQAK